MYILIVAWTLLFRTLETCSIPQAKCKNIYSAKKQLNYLRQHMEVYIPHIIDNFFFFNMPSDRANMFE
jgi:hypothetical protein